MSTPVERQGGNNIWLTPPDYVTPVQRYAPIGLDPCTEASNPVGAEHFFTEEDDGLAQPWSGYGLTYVNPPYSTVLDVSRDDYPDDAEGERSYKAALVAAKRAMMADLKDQGERLFGARRGDISSLIVLWAMKIKLEVDKGVSLIALLPCGARFGTKYWQECILNHELRAMCFVRGRIPFIDGETGEVGSGNLYDSIYYGYNVAPERFDACFSPLGVVTEIKRRRVSPLSGYLCV